MGEPVISVDTQKKELVGDFKNPGREWHPQGRPEPVRIHDFAIRQPQTPVCDAIRAIGQWNTAWDPFYFRRSVLRLRSEPLQERALKAGATPKEIMAVLQRCVSMGVPILAVEPPKK